MPLLTQRLPEEPDDELAELAEEMDQVGGVQEGREGGQGLSGWWVVVGIGKVEGSVCVVGEILGACRSWGLCWACFCKEHTHHDP